MGNYRHRHPRHAVVRHAAVDIETHIIIIMVMVMVAIITDIISIIIMEGIINLRTLLKKKRFLSNKAVQKPRKRFLWYWKHFKIHACLQILFWLTNHIWLLEHNTYSQMSHCIMWYSMYHQMPRVTTVLLIW